MRSEYISEEPDPPGHRSSLCTPGREAYHFLKKDKGSIAFWKRLYPSTTARQWNDWIWQLRHSIHTYEELARIIRLSQDELDAILSYKISHPFRITPYYASLIDTENPAHSLRRSVIPVCAEHSRTSSESDDPLSEDDHSPVPGIVHRYPDRVLFLVTNSCATYCRYCTRSRIIGMHTGSCFNPAQWEKAIAYIEKTPIIRDVLLSGGDPLILKNDTLEWLLARLRKIPHIEILRIGTKVPTVLPQRITPSLVRMLKRYHPLWISIHVIHPEELTEEMSQACTSLANAGIPLGSQTVLLSGINDNVSIMKQLVHGLMKIRVRPYYLYQCDPVSGTTHFRTSVEKGLNIIQQLRGYTTGYAVPNYVIDAPGGGGKILLYKDPIIGSDGHDLLLRNYEGHTFRYPDFRKKCVPEVMHSTKGGKA
ncbi:MAG: KamA family radical SAM protein [bacterium]